MVCITKSYIVMPLKDKNGERKFDSYPTRGITLSDEVWNELKTAKLLYGKNWNSFIKSLLEGKEKQNEDTN